MAEARLIRALDFEPACPPKHVKTDGYPIFTPKTVGAEQIELFLVDIHPGGEGLEDAHPGTEHGFFLLSGRAEVTVEEETFVMEPDDGVFIPAGAMHTIKPLDGAKIRLIAFMAPARQL